MQDIKTSVKKEQSSGISFGSVSIIVIFSTLCLSIFSVLSYSLALSEKRFADKSINAFSSYYAADLAVTKKARELKQMFREGINKDELSIKASEMGFTAFLYDDTIKLSMSMPIDQTRALEVELSVADEFKVDRWMVVSTTDWEPDESIEIWGGE